jgi:hypothetical protein
MPEMSSAERLREYLTRHDSARRLYLTGAQYHMQIRYTCELLDVVDAVADADTAARITDAISVRLAGPAVAEAIMRAAEATVGTEALSLSAVADKYRPRR